MRSRLALAALLAVALPEGAAAQALGAVAARATVAADALVVTATRPLEFGVVVPGVGTTVNARTSLAAGEFDLHGAPRAEFTATFTLPTELTLGAYSMPIAFGAQSGCQDRDDKGNCKYFDPRVPFTGRIANKAAPENTFFFRLGGTVSPAALQQPGTYRGTIAVVVAYTGN